MHRRNLVVFVIFSTLVIFLFPVGNTKAQTAREPRPIDMMVVIDNSCSMFPRTQIVAGCDVWGSDPDFLRITGADLFVARLGFGAPNESDYQLGVISMGEDPVMVSSLQPLMDLRDELARQIAEPEAQTATRLIPAMQMAFNEMVHSPNRVKSHLPAVVLITDGVPYPPDGQSNQDIARIVSSNPEVPLFVMLLQNQTDPSPDYLGYIEFWKQLQNRFSHLFVYQIEKPEQIEATYNAILGQLQGTIPAASVNLQKGKTLNFLVGEYVERVIITVIRGAGQDDAEITITDPNGVVISPGDKGVITFKGQDNPVEVFSIAEPRLSDEVRNGNWSVTTASNVSVLIDREGGYEINFLAPENRSTDIAGVYQVLEHQSTNQELVLRFNLLDWEGNPVLISQEIRGDVVLPDGKEVPLNAANSLQPDAEGVYEIRLDWTTTFPSILEKPGRLTFILRAGVIDEESPDRLPVASTRLLVDAGRMPFIRSVAPTSLLCSAGQSASFRAVIGDYDIVNPDSVNVQLISGTETVELDMIEPGIFTTDLSEWCTQLINAQSCSMRGEDSLTLLFNYKLDGDEISLPVTRPIDVQVVSPECTPAPEPTLEPTPSPAPTPVPDSDFDGLNNLEDRCPSIPGFKNEGGCIPTNYLVIGFGGLGILLVSVNWGWPWVRVRTFAAPPEGYLMVYREGETPEGPFSLQEIGLRRRTSRVAIGGRRRKAHIFIEGLQPVEFVAERKSKVSWLRDPLQPEPFVYFDEQVQLVHTSDPRVMINISLDREKLIK